MPLFHGHCFSVTAMPAEPISKPSTRRSVARLLESADTPLWIITAAHTIGYVSPAAANWLGIDDDALVGRRCIGGMSIGTDPLDQLAASLSPPAGLASAGSLVMRVQPIQVGPAPVADRDVLFTRIGDDSKAITIAVVGEFSRADPNSRNADSHLTDASIAHSIAIRQQLDAWRKRQAALAVTVSAGKSQAAKRLRARLELVARIRCHVGLFGPAGCGAESIATRMHSLSAPGESLLIVDGPLMDAELLEATIAPAIHTITESNSANASLLVRSLDEMPMEAQSRLADVVGGASGRLRLIGLCSTQPKLFREPINTSDTDSLDLLPSMEVTPRVVEPRLAELLSVIHIAIEPLRSRVEDLPLLAAALVDARHAAGEGPAERLSRAALDALVTYPWPGDFAELDAAIRHAVRSTRGDIISPEHLPLAIRSYRNRESPKQESPTVALDEAVSRYEWRLIQDALAATDGNRAEAARRLGVSRARLLRKIDEANHDDSEDES